MNNTLIKGLSLLEALAHSPNPLGITELSEQTRIPKSNVHRILQALVALDYVTKDLVSGKYKPSIRMWSLGTATRAHFDLARLAMPFMQLVRDRTRENVHLAVLDGTHVVYVEKLDSLEPVRPQTRLGGRGPANCLATGMAIVAFYDSKRLAEFSKKLEWCSPLTVTNPREFIEEMRRVRQRGYAVSRGQLRESVIGIAAPIRDNFGTVIASIGLSAPTERVKRSLVKSIGLLLTSVASDISASLAGSLPTRELDTAFAAIARKR